jgi:hypothetical protein
MQILRRHVKLTEVLNTRNAENLKLHLFNLSRTLPQESKALLIS